MTQVPTIQQTDISNDLLEFEDDISHSLPINTLLPTASKHVEDTLAVENSRYSASNCSSADEKGHRNMPAKEGLESASHTPPRGDRLHFSPCHNVENSGSGHIVTVAAPEDAESDHFKNKRAAHYNEFKLGATLLCHVLYCAVCVSFLLYSNA